MRTDYAALAGLIVIQSRRIKAMQRKIDRYKKYARIKHQKESKRIDKECKKITDFFNSGVFVTGRFVKTWKTGETK